MHGKRYSANPVLACCAVIFLTLAPSLVANGNQSEVVSETGSVLSSFDKKDVSGNEEKLHEKIKTGKFPAQLAGHTGKIKPGRYGPSRNNAKEEMPKHAYSPFDERRNRKYPCPPGGCEVFEKRIAIKFSRDVNVAHTESESSIIGDNRLNTALSAHRIKDLKPIFPGAKRTAEREMIVSPEGVRLPKPDLTKWHRASLEKDADIDTVIDSLRKEPGIEWVEPDYVRRPTGEARFESIIPSGGSFEAFPNSFSDPLYDLQWHLSAANVPAAWQWLEQNGYEPGGSRDIIVAVIDTGVDYNHPDLAANIWTNSREIAGNGVDDDGDGFVDDVHGVNVVSNDWSESGDPMDDHGHGTHVAGIIAAQANNGLGGVGVAYNTQIMAIKAAQYSGVLTSTDIAEGIYYAVEHGADVINMSFGGYARSQVEEDALAVAFGQAVLVAAAGNDSKVNLPCPLGRDMYPAAYNWVLGVMASAADGSRASFSNYDCTPHDSHEYELMAPGVDVWSTLPMENYAAWDGTSMAAPVVSGIAALLRTKWTDKDVYSSRFIMGQIAANASPVADAFTSLTVAPKPELSYLEHWVFDTTDQSASNDDDGIVDAGETIDLAIVIRNHWGKADPVSVKLEALAEGAYQPDPYVSMEIDSVDYGAVGSFNQDDNGLIYNAEGVITGVQNPFRFSVSADCPNDHVIPFLLTMTARNGLDPTDVTDYTSQSRFYLIVQRGRELPRIISEDMTLTKDDYWILADSTLIESGATLTITEGTQLQFFSADPDDPYGQDAHPFLQVEGNLYVEGTSTEPVEIFPSALYFGYFITIQKKNNGHIELHYSRVSNPNIGSYYNYSNSDWSYSDPVDIIDHCFFSQDLPYCLYAYDKEASLWACKNVWLILRSSIIRYSIFNKLGFYWYSGLLTEDCLLNNLYVNCIWSQTSTCQSAFGNVFLSSNIYGANKYRYSLAKNFGYSIYYPTLAPGVSPEELSPFKRNAILNPWWNHDVYQWMRFSTTVDLNDARNWFFYITENYWNTTSTTLIDTAIYDFNDDFNLPHMVYEPILTEPPEDAYPFVVDVILSTSGEPDAAIVGAEPVTFTVTFNRDMDMTVQPSVSFGPDTPVTDYTVHPIDGGWLDPRTWAGTFNITPITGDGYQLIRVAGARAADDPWLVTGDDAGRFRFEIITSGTEGMNLQATGGEGYIDLMWSQDDFDLLAGFNLYRSTSATGTFSRLNGAIIPVGENTFRDTNVTPGQPYYYKFTVIKTDMSESDFSNVATATPIDTIPPVINHTPLTSTPPGLSLTFLADVTDNVQVTGVSLYYRTIGAAGFQNKAMVKTSGDRYSTTLEGSLLVSPGIEYYITATDGINTAYSGRLEYPYNVMVNDKPVVTAVTPNRGPASGGTAVTVSGSNLKSGASVTFGGAVCANVSVPQSSQITCATPAHFAETVDVTVTNSDGQSGSLLRAFTYESDTASLSLPSTTGGQHTIVQIPVSASVQGLMAADLTITFDAAILQAHTAARGNLVPGWSMESNTATAGEIRISLASPGSSVTGAGILVNLEFEVVGTPGSSTSLEFSTVVLNDGAIPTQSQPGLLTVDAVYTLFGTVSYWNGDLGVPGVLLTASGDRTFSCTSEANGQYNLAGLGQDDYTLTPGKSDEVNGITAYDASLVLQHAVGLTALGAYAAVAADVNKSGTVNSMDATYILQKAVDLISLPFPGAGTVWQFDPPNKAYADLHNDQTAQDFTAILLGDVNGNWLPAGSSSGVQLPSVPGKSAADICLHLPNLEGAVGAQVQMSLEVSAFDPILAVQAVINYPEELLAPVAVENADLSSNMLIAANLSKPGRIVIAMAGAEAIEGNGELLHLNFLVRGALGQVANVTMTEIAVNDQVLSECIDNGSISIVDHDDQVTTTGVFRPSNGLIYLKKENTTGYADAELVYGIPGDLPIAGDWDGDGVDSIGIYRNGVFYLKNSNETGYADMVFAFGADGNLPVAGDWDGDGIDTIGVYRDGLFMLRNSNDSGPAEMYFALGIPGDVPIAGNWDGNGGDSCGVFRPTNGLIFLKNDNTTGYADIEIVFGIPNDKPIIGDWDGDGIDTIGVYREGAFLLRNSNETGYAEMYFGLGIDGDVPISGKWGLP